MAGDSSLSLLCFYSCVCFCLWLYLCSVLKCSVSSSSSSSSLRLVCLLPSACFISSINLYLVLCFPARSISSSFTPGLSFSLRSHPDVVFIIRFLVYDLHAFISVSSLSFRSLTYVLVIARSLSPVVSIILHVLASLSSRFDMHPPSHFSAPKISTSLHISSPTIP